MRINKRKIIPFLLRLFGNLILIATLSAVIAGVYVCPIYALTHIPCPGCGMTRACKAALRFNFTEAIKYNCLFPIPFLWGIYELIRHRFPLSRKGEMIFYFSSLALLLLRWVILMANNYLI